MSLTVPLTKTVTITLDGSGNGIAQVGPFFNQTWHPSTTNISMGGAIPTGATPATCTISTGFQQQGSQFIDATYQVNGAASSVIDGQVIYYGSYIFATWANGNPNVTASLTVSGTMDIPG